MPSTKSVALNEVPEGAVLAEDVRDAKGQCLVAAGTSLTRSMAQLLQRRGICVVEIKQVQVLTEEQLVVRKVALETELNQLFRRHDKDSTMHEFRQILFDFRFNEDA